MYTSLEEIMYNLLIKWGISINAATIIKDIIGVILLFIFSYIAFLIARKILVSVIHKLTKRTKSNWDDIMAAKKVFSRLAFFLPAWIIYLGIPMVLKEYEGLTNIIQNGVGIYTWILIALMVSSILVSINAIYETYDISKHKPIKGYILFVRIIFWSVAAICIVAILIGKDPKAIFLGMGAFAAILILVFKDPILGLVGSVQLSSNDMLRIGDWISMPTHNADGTVTDISLTTVKVQNWDKTISTIPTYSLISESFQNWRGMEESGGRRIKRSISIDVNSVKFCSPEMLDKFRKVHLLKDYIANTESIITEYNAKNDIDNGVLINGRRQTNLGVFRTYLEKYLKSLSNISEDMTFLVRQLQPTDKGIPLEIYVFSKIQSWAEYEAIQSDIFDHVLAVVPEFELNIYQAPTGTDFRELKK